MIDRNKFESLADALTSVDDLDAVVRAVIREQAIRSVMIETGETREIVIEMASSLESMAQEVVLDLTDGGPTTLRDGLERYVDQMSRTGEPSHVVGSILGDLTALLAYPWPEQATGMAIGREDDLERREGEPEGYHVRETITLERYPLMGSSPAERAESQERADRIRRNAMRDHVFVGEGTNCAAMLPVGLSGSPETGVMTMRDQCGYPRTAHPDQGKH